MLPTSILAQISSHACKVYLALHAHLDPRAPAPVVTLPMNDLTRITGFSSRTCADALRELRQLHLLRRLPFAYHQSRSYQFLPLPPTTEPPPVATHATDPQPVATLLTTDPQPVAGHPNTDPSPRLKNPDRQPLATLLNPSDRPPTAGHDPLGDVLTLLNNVDNLKRQLAQRGYPRPPQIPAAEKGSGFVSIES